MTLTASGPISFQNINTEIGVAVGSSMSLGWVQAHSHYAYHDLNSIYGLTWFAASYSQSVSRTVSSTTPNCLQYCQSLQNCYDYPNYDTIINNVNCAAGSYAEAAKLQKNCNCNCNCWNCYCTSSNCNCAACSDCSGCTCFPKGSLVLMADGSSKEITAVVEGDMLWSPQGPVRCYLAYKTTLADRPLATMEDGSVSWSAEHRFWVKRDDHEAFWSVRKDLIEREIALGAIVPMADDLLFSGEFGKAETFAVIDGWAEHTPIVKIEAGSDPKFPVYLPFTDSIICINGYLVSGAVDQTKYDFYNFKWIPNADI
jgi:hypothetical protein